MFTTDKFSASDTVTRRGVLETEINREISQLIANFSGDNLAVFLTPSGINDEKQRNTVVNEIIRLRDSDKENNKLAVDVINASEAFFSENSAENLTLEIYMVLEHTKNRKGTGVYNDWRTAKNDESGVGKAEQEKSILARAIFSTISSIDNTSMRISAEFMKMTKSKRAIR